MQDSAHRGSVEKVEATAIVNLELSWVKRTSAHLSGNGWIGTGTILPANVANGSLLQSAELEDQDL